MGQTMTSPSVKVGETHIFARICPIPNPQKLGKHKQCSWSHVYMIHYQFS